MERVSELPEPGLLQGLPVWFVLEHGDKFQRDVVLRSGSSPKPWMPWDVRLSVHVRYSTYPDVNFSYGWKGFSAACDLRVGDSLIFLLTEFSEFEVHVFRRTENPDVSSLLTGENQGGDSDLFREKVSKSHGSTSRYMPTESFVELVPHDSCGSIEKRGTIGGEGAVSASPGGTSLKNSNCNMTTKVSIYFFHKVHPLHHSSILNFKYSNRTWRREMSNRLL